MKPGAKPEGVLTAREVAHEHVNFDERVCGVGGAAYGVHCTLCNMLTAAIEARDSHLREVHARELAELRAKVIEECARAALAWWDSDDTATGHGDVLLLAAARIRALGGKVEP